MERFGAMVHEEDSRCSRVLVHWVVVGTAFALLFASPVAAEPSVGTLERADATVRIEAGKKTVHVLRVSVERVTGVGGAILAVSLQKCDPAGDCKVPINYTKEVSDAEFSMTPSPEGTTATLSSIFAGLPLEVEWASSSTVVGADASLPQEVVLGTGGQADAQVSVAGLSCSALGNVQFGVLAAVDRQTPAADREWPERLPRSLRRGVPACAG